MLKSEIFHKYDVRGIYGKTFTDEDALIFGKALGTYLRNQDLQQIVIGADNRPSGTALKSSLLEGLVQCGISAIDIGVVTTPMVLFAEGALIANASIVITASHNPNEYNGLKVAVKGRPLTQSQYLEIREIAVSGEFLQRQGVLSRQDVWPMYKQSISSIFNFKKLHKVAVNTKGGVCADYAQELFETMGIDVVDTKPDLILEFDTDGDRLSVRGKDGTLLTCDLIAGVFAKSIIEEHERCSMVFDISVVGSLIRYISALGGQVHISSTGYPNIVEMMHKTKSIFGSEVSGHYFFRDKHLGYNDAFYAACRLLEILDKTNSTIENLIKVIPFEDYTEVLRTLLPVNTNRAELENALKVEFEDAHLLTLDGVRFSYPDFSWGVVRLSNTENMICVRAGAQTKERLEEIKDLIKNILKKYTILIDWDKHG